MKLRTSITSTLIVLGISLTCSIKEMHAQVFLSNENQESISLGYVHRGVKRANLHGAYLTSSIDNTFDISFSGGFVESRSNNVGYLSAGLGLYPGYKYQSIVGVRLGLSYALLIEEPNSTEASILLFLKSRQENVKMIPSIGITFSREHTIVGGIDFKFGKAAGFTFGLGYFHPLEENIDGGLLLNFGFIFSG